MRSIRLSLLVYFLLLLSVALGAIGWLSYEATRRTLHDKEEAQRTLLTQVYDNKCQAVREEHDKSILQVALLLAKLAQWQNPEAVINERLRVAGACVGITPASQFIVPFCGGLPPGEPLSRQVWGVVRNTASIWIPHADDVLRSREEGLHREDGLHREEFFQVYNVRGLPQQRSASLPEGALGLNADEELEPYEPRYDETDLTTGQHVRVVTCRLPVSLFRFEFARYWPQSPTGRQPNPGNRPPNAGGRGTRNAQQGRAPAPGQPAPARQCIIQCGYDTTGRDATLAKYRAELDGELEHLEAESQDRLTTMRRQFLQLGLLTFAATVVGGLWLVTLGLSPLRRLSDAVSRVTPRDFKLPLKSDSLPHELKPIAERLAAALELLRKAFEREKQAAADISHELRTPIAALLANVDVILKKPRTPEEYRAVLEECRASGRQINHLVERLLTLARLDAGVDQLRVKEVDVASLAESCTELVQPLAKAREVELSLHCPHPVQLRTDPDKFREVLSNLLHNAVEYNKPGGSIDVRVGRKNGSLLVEVTDTGIGIPPEARERIFERFYRADPSRQADGMHTGLGLAITRSYVELLGGSIAVDSTPGQGSRFSVELPIR